ncbi:hypothetical protein [Salinadaptatus halalkaliphilus]|uniref:hypothetical protein n=1 Tax=Salinadaptatus halalkaliphilus TaxID=2419781 RepID=UPI0015805C98|nr:hypothetical protein [Salinadaptatus halalkaliphilus]
MKRALAITLTVAMIGSLAFMGFAGTAAAQEDQIIDQAAENVSLDADQQQDLMSGDAETNVNVDQSNDNAQVGSATAGDAVALSGGGGAGAAGAAHDKGGAAAGAGGAGGGATAASAAETNQVQDVNQINAADVDATAESGDVTGEQNLTQEPTQEAEQVDEGDVDIDAGLDNEEFFGELSALFEGFSNFDPAEVGDT